MQSWKQNSLCVVRVLIKQKKTKKKKNHKKREKKKSKVNLILSHVNQTFEPLN